MHDSAFIRAARAVIVDPNHWSTEALARDEDGNETWPKSPEATSWCAIGAIRLVSPDEDPLMIPEVMKTVADQMIEEFKIEEDSLMHPVAVLNDYGNHALVIQMFDRALALAEKEEQKDVGQI